MSYICVICIHCYLLYFKHVYVINYIIIIYHIHTIFYTKQHTIMYL